MTWVFAGVRALVYMTGFVFLWGWVALQARSLYGGFLLPTGFRPVGAALIIAGGTVVVSCAGWFLVAGRGTPAPFDAPRAFVAGGPYRWVRNPMYLGALPVLIGFGLWHRSLSMALLALPAAAAAHLFVVWYEEPTLRRRFGLPYVAYLALVNRWLPKRPRPVALIAALALALTPVFLSGQGPASAPDAVVWHWFGACASGDSLVLEVTLDGKAIYSSTFPICQARRRAIKPEPQQRILEFRFDAAPRRFGPRSRATDPQAIAANIWQAGAERNAITLGVSFSAENLVLLNMRHEALAVAASRSERVRGLVITTRPARRGDRPGP